MFQHVPSMSSSLVSKRGQAPPSSIPQQKWWNPLERGRNVLKQNSSPITDKDLTLGIPQQFHSMRATPKLLFNSKIGSVGGSVTWPSLWRQENFPQYIAVTPGGKLKPGIQDQTKRLEKIKIKGTFAPSNTKDLRSFDKTACYTAVSTNVRHCPQL